MEIDCDPRSLEREILTPGRVTGITGHRIRKTLPKLREKERAWEVEQARISEEARRSYP